MKNPLDRFKLLPIKSAKVSEISEATVSAKIPPSNKVNYHIGNPVQDERLIDFYFNLVSDIEDSKKKINNDSTDKFPLIETSSDSNYHHSAFLKHCIRKCSPYMPRGGYTSSNPGELIQLFKNWLTSEQNESLDYNFGDSGGYREVILSNGGTWENLRILFSLIDKYLLHLPARVLLYNVELPAHLYLFNSIEIEPLPEHESTSLEKIQNHFVTNLQQATFVILGTVPSERFRREIRNISLTQPLFFVEINNAANDLSLQREAKMLNRVLRMLTPAAISQSLSEISVNFIAGNADFIKVFENVQFELKGTPAAAEVELLAYILKNKIYTDLNRAYHQKTNTKNSTDYTSGISGNWRVPIDRVANIAEQISKKAAQASDQVDDLLQTYSEFGKKLNEKIQNLKTVTGLMPDDLSLFNTTELLNYFFENIDQKRLSEELNESFLNVFVNHHPEYNVRNCLLVSGSARTALSVLGNHCGIHEVVSVDLSWTYEHCFQATETIFLQDDLTLDPKAIIQAIENKLSNNPDWKRSGAVVLNNPHNASGKIFNEDNLSCLLKWLLEKEIFVIDDLSYQNVMPEKSLNGPKTLRQLANQIVKDGYLVREYTKYLITVNSLSKTDSFAGARLAVIEILHPELLDKFKKINSGIKPNTMAILLAYLFYRNHPEQVKEYWLLRNQIFNERMEALEEACSNLPDERNPFEIEIQRPSGSMYPHMIINKLPDGISLDWLSSGLAANGIGLIPLSVFARTAKGYDLARKSFRLTLGGETNPDELKRKTRRVLIDLNRMIAEERSNYNKHSFNISKNYLRNQRFFNYAILGWQEFTDKFLALSQKRHNKRFKEILDRAESQYLFKEFIKKDIPERLEVFNQRFKDRLELSENILSIAQSNNRTLLLDRLQSELYKDNLENRIERFRQRLYDRTVHPTQMYALKVELIFDRIQNILLQKGKVNNELINSILISLADEFLGYNVPINSVEEADELVTDLKMVVMAEEFTRLSINTCPISFLSFWGDWDGSTRPSGQGHRLVMAVLIENVRSLANLLQTLINHIPNIIIEHDLLYDLHRLDQRNTKSLQLSNKINSLTNELEKRYYRVLPVDEKVNPIRNFGQRLGIIKDPLSALWQHNDRLEKKMLDLRNQRSKTMDYYFSLNKRLRKTLYRVLPQVEKSLHLPEMALSFGFYRDYLQRFCLTPRIHQKIIKSSDQFTIDTTLQNIMEINNISGNYGNPGMILALQISMTTEPETIIDLDRKSRSKREQFLRDNPNCALPPLGLIPLFEDEKSVSNIENFLDKIWKYCLQTQYISQETHERFSELITEIFVAGSDLSQQVGQPASLALFKEAKFRAIRWFAEKGLVDKIRVKLGSGESMQRQGGYYETLSGKSAFLSSNNAKERLTKNVKESTYKSTYYAKSPLRGVFSGGELRTFQSTVSEKLRMISMAERAQLLHHVKESQKFYRDEIIRASEPLLDTRLQYKNQGVSDLENITQQKQNEFFKQFLELTSRNFREILYGRDEDIIGIHIISYFISQAIPTLRDRPTIRPSREMSHDRGQKIIERIARTLPLSKYGSLLRAIGHNRSQTMVLGINQLSTGLFRAFLEFCNAQINFTDGVTIISDHILPNLPVHDLLHTIRLYQDTDLRYIKRMQKAFPAGNSSFTILLEDNGAINYFIILLQKELLRRHGLDVTDFFNSEGFLPQLLPTLRPDLAVLLQPDIFNNNIEKLISDIGGIIDSSWIQEIKLLLEMPEKIRSLREKIWQIIEVPIYQQIESFVHLSTAIYKIYQGTGSTDVVFTAEPGKVMRLSSNIKDLLRYNKDDSMRQFLIAVVQYLTQLPQTKAEVPIDIIRTLQDIERIVKIEEQALSKKEQDLIRFYILQIARLCGENG